MLADGLNVTERQHWDQFVHAHPNGTIYHLSHWGEVIGRLFGQRCYYVQARDEGGARVRGVLPLVRLKSVLFGDYLVSMPYFNYGGALAENSLIAEALADRAALLAKNCGSRHLELRDTDPTPDRWPVRTDKVVMELELPAAVEHLWSGFTPKLRAQIRRPSKEGITAHVGGEELLADFYRVFSCNMRDLGTPVYPFSFFRAIFRAFPAHSNIVVAKHAGRTIAGGYLLGWRDRLEIPWASSLREFNRTGANMLMYWAALKHAIEKGFRVFDFGRSTPDSGTYRFKQQWGAQPRQLYWHYWLREGDRIPRLTPDNPKYRLAIAVWKRLPMFIANALGPLVVKNLP